MALSGPIEVPRIYVGRQRRADVLPGGRVLAGVTAGLCLAVLIVASGLSPNANGFGTHRQLGLAECGFLARTGLPCPACGMTTSFAWFVHGNAVASFYVQPMGCVLAALTAMTVWAAGYVAITGRPVHRVLAVIPEKMILFPLLTLAIAGWGWKIYIHLHGVDGWK